MTNFASFAQKIGYAATDVEKDAHLNGYKPKSYGDLLAIASIGSIFIGLCLWGLKLEGRIDQAIRQDLSFQSRVSSIEERIRPGILSIADERIRSMQRHHEELEAQFNEFVRYHEENFIPAKRLEDGIKKDIDRLESLLDRMERESK